jgi:hypothetical protein
MGLNFVECVGQQRYGCCPKKIFKDGKYNSQKRFKHELKCGVVGSFASYPGRLHLQAELVYRICQAIIHVALQGLIKRINNELLLPFFSPAGPFLQLWIGIVPFNVNGTTTVLFINYLDL